MRVGILWLPLERASQLSVGLIESAHRGEHARQADAIGGVLGVDVDSRP